MDIGKGGFKQEALDEYARCCTPENIHGVCENYRASVSVDFDMDKADWEAGRKIQCPSAVYWGELSHTEKFFNPREAWPPYAANIVNFLGGQIQLIVSTVLSAMPQIQSGKLRGLAVTTVKRSAALPNVPTIAESGVPGYEATAWSMLLAPAQMPHAIITRIHASTVRVLDQAEVRKRYAAESGQTVCRDP